jgi:hypothetical protein
VCGLVLMRWLCFWRPPCLLRRVIVNFTHNPEEAIEGVLWSYRWGWLTLRDTAASVQGNKPRKLEPPPGEVVIHRSQIAFMQVVS